MEVTRNFLLWCTIINYGILLAWFLFFALTHDWMYRQQFPLSEKASMYQDVS